MFLPTENIEIAAESPIIKEMIIILRNGQLSWWGRSIDRKGLMQLKPNRSVLPTIKEIDRTVPINAMGSSLLIAAEFIIIHQYRFCSARLLLYHSAMNGRMN